MVGSSAELLPALLPATPFVCTSQPLHFNSLDIPYLHRFQSLTGDARLIAG